mgnify:CR=1 FL=1
MKMMIRPAKITHSMLLDLAKRAREDHERKNADGTEFISRTPMVTGKGQRYFISKFLETKDEEALADIREEELKLQREDNLFASNIGDYKPQLTAEELNALDAEAKEVAAALGEVDDLEPLDKAHNELESINNAGSDAELEGIDE